MSDHPREDLPDDAESDPEESDGETKPKQIPGLRKLTPLPSKILEDTDAPKKEAAPKKSDEDGARDSDAGDSDAPDSDGPDSDAPDSDGPDSDGPDSDGPDSDGPDSDGPDSDAGDAPDGGKQQSEAPAIEAGTAPPEVSDAAPASDAPPEAVRRGPISVKLFGRTDVGQIREHNEDNFMIADLSSKVRGVAGAAKTMEVGPGGVLMAVCDGMGGAAAGEVASQLATDIIYQRMATHAGHEKRDQLALDIVDALEIAGSRILQESTSNRACRGMGTTATVAALVDDHLLLGQVGDSRAYILRGDRLVQVTRDQSLVNQLIEAGQLTEEEAENFEHSNIILQALGTAEAVQVDLTFAPLRRGDVLMMCSDGLSGMIRNAEIAETLTNVPDPVEACRVLIDDANQAGGHDNITVIVAVFDGEGLHEATLDDVEELKYEKYALPSWGSDRGRGHGIDDEDTYDSTPSIEITGEFEVRADTNWDKVLDDRPDIPKEAGPNMSSIAIWVCLVGLVLALYFLFFAR